MDTVAFLCLKPGRCRYDCLPAFVGTGALKERTGIEKTVVADRQPAAVALRFALQCIERVQGIPESDASNTIPLFVHLTGTVDVSTFLKLGGYEYLDGRRWDSGLFVYTEGTPDGVLLSCLV